MTTVKETKPEICSDVDIDVEHFEIYVRLTILIFMNVKRGTTVKEKTNVCLCNYIVMLYNHQEKKRNNLKRMQCQF